MSNTSNATIISSLTELGQHGGVFSARELNKVLAGELQDTLKIVGTLVHRGLLREHVLDTTSGFDASSKGLTLYRITKTGAAAAGLPLHSRATRDAEPAKLARGFARTYSYVNRGEHIAAYKNESEINAAFRAKGLPGYTPSANTKQADIYESGGHLLVLHTPNVSENLGLQIRFMLAAWRAQFAARQGALRHLFVVPASAVQELAEILVPAMHGLNRPIAVEPLDTFLAQGWEALGKSGTQTNAHGYNVFNSKLSPSFWAWPGSPTELRELHDEYDNMLTSANVDNARGLYLQQRLAQAPALLGVCLTAPERARRAVAIQQAPARDATTQKLRELRIATLTADYPVPPPKPGFSRDKVPCSAYKTGLVTNPRNHIILFHTFFEESAVRDAD